MPKSKRNKQIELAKTKKRGLDWKKRLFEEVRSCVDSYTNVFVFSVNDMRNSKMKNVREQWKHSRFFIGKNKIMAMALGRFAEEEYKPNLHKLGQQIKGQCGLLFSNKSVEEVLNWFRSYSEGDYARSGNIATDTVNLTTGPLTMFPHNLEPYLRQLGLPTALEKGVIHLIKDHEVCKAGDTLTPETAKILKLLGYEMAEFHITIDCVWSHDGSFIQLTENVASDAKEKGKQVKLSLDSKFSKMKQDSDIELEHMDVEHVDDKENSKDNIENSASDIKFEQVDDEEPVERVEDEEPVEQVDEEPVEQVEDEQPVEQVEDEEVVELVDDEKSKDENINNASDIKFETLNKASLNNISTTSTPKEKIQNNVTHINDEIPEINDTFKLVENTDSVIQNGNKKRPYLGDKTPKSSAKQETVLKTPDANTSQESPIFRELRSRSVKVNRKRK